MSNRIKHLLALAGILAVSALIWFGGPYLAFAKYVPLAQPMSRLILIAALLIAWGFFTPKLSIRKHHNEPSTAGSNPEIELLKNSINEIALYLKQHINKQHDKLPLYLVLGLENTGKSTLIAHAELEPLDTSEPAPESAQRNHFFSWHFTAQGIFVDISAQHLLLNEHGLWHVFVNALRQLHKTNPLTGILLVSQPQTMSSLQAQQSQLDKLQTSLVSLSSIQHTIPTFLIYNKCDLIAGFAEFYDDLGTEERRQAWGITFDSNNINPQQSFEQQFQALLERLNQRLLWGMHKEHDLNKRFELKDFPTQLESQQQAFAKLTAIIHLPHLHCKGMFFTSSEQTGTPVNFLTQPINQAFNLNSQLTTSQASTNRPYFITDLLHNIIKPSEEQTVPQLVNHKIRHQALAAAVVIVLAGAGFWTYSYTQNIAAIHAVQTALAQSNSHSMLTRLSVLAQARDALAKTSDNQIFNFGLNNKKMLLTEANIAYQVALTEQFAPKMQQIINHALQTAHANRSSNLYSTLSIALAFSKPNNPEAKNRIRQWFAHYWQTTLVNNPQEQQQLNKHFNELLSLENTHIYINPELVSNARMALNNMPLIKLGFMILQHRYTGQQFNLYNPQNNAWFNKPAKISTLYTTINLHRIYSTTIPDIIQTIGHGIKVLGQNSPQIKAANNNPQRAIANLQAMYLQHYAKTWKQALDTVHFTQINTLKQAIQLSSILGSTHSPLLQLLENIQTNTVTQPNNSNFNKTVSQNFSELNKYVNSADEGALQMQLSSFALYFQQIDKSSNSQRSAFLAAKKRMQSDGNDDELYNLLEQAKQAPQPLQTWLNALASQSWHVMLLASRQYINSMWTTNVLPSYKQNLNNRYPLFKNSDANISLKDFQQFFSSNGIINGFFNQYLKPFVDDSNFYWVWKRVDGQRINISQNNLDMFIRASLIKKMYFEHNTDRLYTRFTLTPLTLKPNTSSVLLDVDGQKENFSKGLNQYFIWPGMQSQTAAISFMNPQANTITERATGPWAWFRLLDKAQLTATGNSKDYELTFKVGGNEAKYQLAAVNVINPYLPNIISTFRCPQTL